MSRNHHVNLLTGSGGTVHFRMLTVTSGEFANSERSGPLFMKSKCPPNPGYLVNGDDTRGKTACVKLKN